MPPCNNKPYPCSLLKLKRSAITTDLRSSRSKVSRYVMCNKLSTSEMVTTTATIMEMAFRTFFGKSVPTNAWRSSLAIGFNFRSTGLRDCDSNRNHASIKASVDCLPFVEINNFYLSNYSSIEPSGCSLNEYWLFESAHVISLICISSFQNM